jgi:hypothetical protein
MSAETLCTQAPTFQIDKSGLYVANLVARELDGRPFSELQPMRALETLSSMFFQAAPDNGIEMHPIPYGYTRIIPEGFVGNEDN